MNCLCKNRPMEYLNRTYNTRLPELYLENHLVVRSVKYIINILCLCTTSTYLHLNFSSSGLLRSTDLMGHGDVVVETRCGGWERDHSGS